ncbi:hypothetical protein GSU68_14355 [Rathayibacter sp. VKM Ac-2759]|uniref:hypothetical protein n=1 Tax=Rathayibacter sp. VKM Ac-2759 TaxID=2609252 RepID=UPI001318E7AA|nr:hypothetical protein [Rathayibacter sp. VKM Ac-2759]QHC67632.1 hypothetical protein GSU68_14355 [Rathayibacter sp. VKM Ac-2759]
MRSRAAVTVLGLLACALALGGCAMSSPPVGDDGPAGCVPLVRIEPRVASPGETVTVVVADGCDLETPEDGWDVVVAPVGGLESGVRSVVSTDLGEGFSVDVVLPADFPAGEAFGGIDGWDFSHCPDSASCASPTGDFTVR